MGYKRSTKVSQQQRRKWKQPAENGAADRIAEAAEEGSNTSIQMGVNHYN